MQHGEKWLNRREWSGKVNCNGLLLLCDGLVGEAGQCNLGYNLHDGIGSVSAVMDGSESQVWRKFEGLVSLVSRMRQLSTQR